MELHKLALKIYTKFKDQFLQSYSTQGLAAVVVGHGVGDDH